MFENCDLYNRYFPMWQKCRDAINGEDAVKSKGQIYLPEPSGMDKDDYKAYLLRGQFFNASGRTLDGLVGMAFRKHVICNVPKGLEKYLQNVDGKGSNFEEFSRECFQEVLTTGWGCVLVDMPVTENIQSQRDFENANLYAYTSFYRAEDIIKWKWKTDNREKKLQYCIFKEDTEIETAPYTTTMKTYYRVCELDEDGYYRQTLYNDNNEIIFQTYPTTKQGKYKFIPVFFFLGNTPQTPLLLDLINVNLSHYRKSADLENGAHWTGVPTPYERGWTPETQYDKDGNPIATEKMKLGGSEFLYFPESVQQVAYLEFSGQGCNLLREMMSDDENRMAILGARIISQEKNGVEAAETAKIHRAGENSVLASIAINVSKALQKMLKVYLEWSAGIEIGEDEIEVKINTDYDVATMSPAELSALVALWQSGGIAKRDLFDNLKDGEILNSERDFKDMQTEIDEENQKITNPQK